MWTRAIPPASSLSNMESVTLFLWGLTVTAAGVVYSAALSLWGLAVVIAGGIKLLVPYLWGLASTFAGLFGVFLWGFAYVVALILLISCVQYIICVAVKAAISESLDSIVKYADERLKMLKREEKRKLEIERRLFNGHSQYCGCKMCVA